MSTSILLVEDENIVAMEIADLLRSLGHGVCGIVSSGEEAIARVDGFGPVLARRIVDAMGGGRD